MTINIKATNTSLTPAIKEFIEDKLQSLAKFIKPEHKIRVELEVLKKHRSGMVHRTEIDIQPQGYFADSLGMDFYSALDLTLPKIREQLTKAKDKQVSARRRRTKI